MSDGIGLSVKGANPYPEGGATRASGDSGAVAVIQAGERREMSDTIEWKCPNPKCGQWTSHVIGNYERMCDFCGECFNVLPPTSRVRR